MHSPIYVLATMMWVLGLAASALFTVTFLMGLFFSAVRGFAALLIKRSIYSGIIVGVLMVVSAQGSLPPPYKYQIVVPGFVFGFGVAGLLYFIVLSIKSWSKSRATTNP